MTIETRKNKNGEVTGYRLRACVGRDEKYKQVWRTCTIPRPEGLTPVREKKEVQRIADEWETEQKEEYARTHRKEDKSRITLADFIENHFVPDYVKDGSHKATTVEFYENMVTPIISYFRKEKQLAQISVEDVKRFIRYLNTEGKTKGGKPYSKSTVQHVYKALKSILEYAKRIRYIKENPCDYLSQKDKPHRQKMTIDFLAPDEAKRFLQCLESENIFWKVFMNILLFCGLRRGEAVGLQWGDVDKDKMTLTVARNVTADKNAPEKYTVTTPKTGEGRTVPLSPKLLTLLADLKRERETHFGAKLFPSSYIFSRDDDPGKPIYPTVPTRWQKRFVQRHDLRDVSPHDLRHSAATLSLAAGADMKQVQELLGHADATTTMENYAGVLQEVQRETMTKIESLLG